MSLVIAVKDKDRIVLGSDKQTSTAYNKDHSCTKIWEVPDMEGAVMGGVGSARASQIIQFSPVVDKNQLMKDGPTLEFLVTSLGPTIMATLEANGVNCTADESNTCKMLPNSFIFAYKDKAWMIWNDLSITEINDYLAIGSGSDVAKGVLYATQDQNPFDRIVTSIDAAADSTLFVDDGLDILMTETRPSDKKEIAAALGFELKDVEKALQELSQETSEEAATEPKEKKSKKSKTKKK